MTMEELKEGMLKRPENFAYWGELDLSVWGFAPIGRHRDSDALTESNFDTAYAELRSISGKSVQIMHTSHALVGWYDHVMVKVTAKKTMAKLLDICNRLDAYPALDGEDWARREFEQASEAYDRWARYDVAKLAEAKGINVLLDGDGNYDPKPEDEETVRELVTDAIMEHNPSEGSYSDEHLTELLLDAFPEVSRDGTNLTLF